jgi:DNA-binding XRE family transcriptional regulator
MGFTKRKIARASRLFHPEDIIFKTHVGRKLDMAKNSLKKIRESLLMSKSELAREANVSPITITRIEEGKPCRMETKRKILLALGYSLSDAKKIFNE